jgi:DNA-binding NarL/FixJ family response regulator
MGCSDFRGRYGGDFEGVGEVMILLEMLIKFEEETEKPVKSMGIIETVETYYQEYGEKKERSATVVKLFNRGFEVKQIADILEIKEKEVRQLLKDKPLI